jgi:hypothetical protein
MQLCARVPSPFRVHPLGVQSVVIFPGPVHNATRTLPLRQPRTLFHILPPLVECRVLSCNRPISNRFSQSSVLSFLHSEDNRLINRGPNKRVEHTDLPRNEVEFAPEGLGRKLSNSYTARRTFLSVR